MHSLGATAVALFPAASTARAWCDAHHLVLWTKGGLTNLREAQSAMYV